MQTVANKKVSKLLEAKLDDFGNRVECSKILEIDSLIEEGGVEGFKVVNHEFEKAFFVPIDLLIRTPLDAVVKALETNEFHRLESVTRIVGYYSRVRNWNSSKLSELNDRAKGNYWNKTRVLAEDTQAVLHAR